jgi:hypothetical protein
MERASHQQKEARLPVYVRLTTRGTSQPWLWIDVSERCHKLIITPVADFLFGLLQLVVL